MNGHSVHFYEDESFLLEGLGRFIGAALLGGDSAVVIATEAHRKGLQNRLGKNGLNLTVPASEGRFLMLDAAETLARFMVDGLPDSRRFHELVGGHISQLKLAARTEGRRVAAFGEMVALLWSEGKPEAAIQLEKLWNELAEKHSFQLHCAYPLHLFSQTGDGAGMEKIFAEHSHVIPSEQYTALSSDDERLRTIVMLQQKAQALETEIRQREKIQEELKKREADLTDFFENAVVAMHWVAADGSILWANGAELAMLGYDKNEYIGHHIAEFHADKSAIEDILRRLTCHEELHGYKARLLRKDGTIKEVRIHSNVFTDEGKFAHTRCFTIDITERERSERRVAAQHAITRLLSESVTLAEAADLLLETICNSEECEMAVLWLADESRLRCAKTWRRTEKQFQNFDKATLERDFEKGQGLPGRIWAANAPIWIEDIAPEPNLPRKAKALEDGIRSAFGFPVSTMQGVLGVIEFFARETRKVDKEFMRMMAAIGTQIGQFMERKGAEQALRASEERSRAIIQTTPECVKIVAEDGTLLHMNAAGLAMVGAERPEMVVSKSIYDVIAPKDREKFRGFNERICRGEKGFLEFDLIDLQGRRHHMETHAAPLRNPDGSLAQLAVTRDVTEEKSTQEILKESEARLRLAQQAGQIGTFEWNAETDVNQWSPELEALYGLPQGASPGKLDGWIQLVHPDDRTEVLKQMKTGFETGTPVQAEWRVVWPDGSIHWIAGRWQVFQDHSGRPVRVSGVNIDITGRKDAEEARRRLAAIVESSDDAIASKDLNGMVTSWNKSAERLFGYAAKEIIGKPVTLIIPPELHQDEDLILSKIKRGEKIDHFETVRVKKSGERIDVSLTISPVRDEQGKVVGAAKIVRDITENKKIDHALRTTEKLAAAGRLAATVAHEINNPLEAVTNLVYLAKRDVEDRNKASRHLEAAMRELDRVAHIARQTLGFYRDTSSPTRFSLTQTLDDLLFLYEKRFESRNIRIIKQYQEDIQLTALAGEIRQALSNLITNAIDAMPEGGSLVIRATKSHEWGNAHLDGVRVTLLDTGMGIAPEHRKSLFQPFFTTKAEVGTGLGLWITRSIVEKHHGMIHVKSRAGENGHGTAFSIFLPSEGKAGNLETGFLSDAPNRALETGANS